MCLDGEREGCELNRRDFLIVGTAAFTGLGALGAEGAAQEKEQPLTRVLDHPDIQHGKVSFKHGGKETFDGFLARPKAEGTFPAVLVIAGNRISEEYIPNTCAALALAGFVGLAPDTFHPLPDSAKTNEDYDKALKEHTKYDVLQDIQVGADYLKTQPFVKVRGGSEARDSGQPVWARGLGILGFCFGGRMAMLFAARSREVDAAVLFTPAWWRPTGRSSPTCKPPSSCTRAPPTSRWTRRRRRSCRRYCRRRKPRSNCSCTRGRITASWRTRVSSIARMTPSSHGSARPNSSGSTSRRSKSAHAAFGLR